MGRLSGVGPKGQGDHSISLNLCLVFSWASSSLQQAVIEGLLEIQRKKTCAWFTA